jgi:hypothetical protein
MKRATAERWVSSKRILLFHIANEKHRLLITLVVGPGEEDVRRALVEGASEAGGPFDAVRQSSWQDRVYPVLFEHHVLTHVETQPIDQEDLEALFLVHWDQFLTIELPQIIERLREPIRKVEAMLGDSSTKGLSGSAGTT